ncbi:membrane protein insertase YidC [Psychroflexus sp. CAK57W]|uniref:membrane protein insertase YidC n=1 Tax=Psychroflexus curvus TaxID=2873595 RepID=UPI001CCEA40B|nr:membrane protein insertase YidC [Psychroflexus curvus]MBZ9627985.1 membrane protein insertase YidC [Psychroflexus curvus]MBZ9787683.1 membrane protein insertase YidC [Psychroflexus curvus]
MEDKKTFDKNSIIGFTLIGLILILFMYLNPTEEVVPEDKSTEQVETTPQKNPELSNTQSTPSPAETLSSSLQDSVNAELAKREYGAFAYSAVKDFAKDDAVTTIENEVLELQISNKGGQIVEAKMKQHDTYKGNPVYLIKDGNASFNISFEANDGRTYNTSDLYFEPNLSTENGNPTLSMRAKVSDVEYLEFYYGLESEDYMINFGIRSQGLSEVISSDNANLSWEVKALRKAKSISYENRYTEIVYLYEDEKDDYTGQGDEAIEEDKLIEWIAFKQHFFTSILLTDTPFSEGKMTSRNLVQDEQVDTLFTKNFLAEVPLKLKNGEFSESLNWYHGPTDFKILSDYDRQLDEIVPLGWGLFGWINRYIFIPFFGFLSSSLPSYGLAIIVMTIVVRIVLSPITYKSYLSQAKMKVLKPEINEINEKYKDNAMKKQQETMKLYSKTGVSPLAGCIPALLQIPVFYALFQFFPSAFDLRQKGFLWAEDLSSYDVIYEWDTYIPLVSWAYGNHVSLFPILASVAIFFYTQMTAGQNMQQSSQPGMPNMKVIMYFAPLVMLIFFNNYASGLSLYYFISNLITIGIMLVIKHVIIDENKILAKIEEKKKKPKKKGKLGKKFQEIMDQAAEQQKKKQSEKEDTKKGNKKIDKK